MYLVLFYDITSTRIRNKVASACQDYGLDRTQFSAFVGDLSRSRQRELMTRLKRLIGEADGALLLIPISEDEWKKRLEFRQNAPGDSISTHPSSIAEREEHDGSLY
jgi:CRISPR-associated protein Cas2